MCSQGKKSLEMELTLILLITLIWLSVYKKNIFLILLFTIHKEKIKKKRELTACQNTVEPRYNKPLYRYLTKSSV